MVNNHGDRKSPRPGVVGPLPNGLYKWLITGGDPNHLLTGMIPPWIGPRSPSEGEGKPKGLFCAMCLSGTPRTTSWLVRKFGKEYPVFFSNFSSTQYLDASKANAVDMFQNLHFCIFLQWLFHITCNILATKKGSWIREEFGFK